MIFLLLLLCGCEQTEVITVKVDLPNDPKCNFFIENELDTLRFERNIKILKNTLTDTIILGAGVLAPKSIGERYYSKFGNRDDVLLAPDYPNPPADRICVFSFISKPSVGELTIEVILAEEE